MNKFFDNEDKKIETFQKKYNNQDIFFGSKKDQIFTESQQNDLSQIKSGEMARYIESEIESEKNIEQNAIAQENHESQQNFNYQNNQDFGDDKGRNNKTISFANIINKILKK